MLLATGARGAVGWDGGGRKKDNQVEALRVITNSRDKAVQSSSLPFISVSGLISEGRDGARRRFFWRFEASLEIGLQSGEKGSSSHLLISTSNCSIQIFCWALSSLYLHPPPSASTTHDNQYTRLTADTTRTVTKIAMKAHRPQDSLSRKLHERLHSKLRLDWVAWYQLSRVSTGHLVAHA
eukprot:2800059-Rhodomonas_salina.2